MEFDSKEIMAKNIKRLMDKKGVTASIVCNDLDIPMATFSDWLHAKTYPRIDKIEIMAQYFNVNKSSLIEEYNPTAQEIESNRFSKMTVGGRIKAIREKNGWSQEELAKKMGYAGKTSISKIESAGDYLTTRTVQKFADALGVKVSCLMGWDDVEWNPKSQEIESNGYYFDSETQEIAQFLSENPEYKVLFDASRKVKAEDIKKALKVLGAFLDEE